MSKEYSKLYDRLIECNVCKLENKICSDCVEIMEKMRGEPYPSPEQFKIWHGERNQEMTDLKARFNKK